MFKLIKDQEEKLYTYCKCLVCLLSWLCQREVVVAWLEVIIPGVNTLLE